MDPKDRLETLVKTATGVTQKRMGGDDAPERTRFRQGQPVAVCLACRS
jgi:hypothetical protein